MVMEIEFISARLTKDGEGTTLSTMLTMCDNSAACS